MRGRAVNFGAGAFLLGAALAVGCGKRTLDSHGPGTGALDAGGGAGGRGGPGGGGASVGAGGFGGIIPPGDLTTRGESCVDDAQCATGFCTDGVCCDGACAGGCQRCDQPGRAGTCTPLANGATPKTSDACPVEIALTCGADGTCDGAGACRLRVAGTVCRAASCDGDTVVAGMACDGYGYCLGGGNVVCVPYRCDPATARCKPGCASDADCVGTYCQTNGLCYTGPRETCSLNSQCASGFCANRLCCNTACTDPCMACDLPNHEGACTPRPDGCAGTDGGSD